MNTGKIFLVACISRNPNSFGLHGHILVASDGVAYEVARSRGSWNLPWNEGDAIRLSYDANENPIWGPHNVEIPRRLNPAPDEVVKRLFPAAE